MSRYLRQSVVFLTLLAWLSASGLSWDLLQVVAWTRMSVENASRLTAAEAVAKTMEDAPCELCKAARKGRQDSEQSPLAKQPGAKDKLKKESAVATLTRIAFGSLDQAGFLRPEDVHAHALCREVPVPPPRSVV